MVSLNLLKYEIIIWRVLVARREVSDFFYYANHEVENCHTRHTSQLLYGA